MDLHTYRHKNGVEAIEKLCSSCDVAPRYMEHLVAARKRPSVDLAHELIKVSKGELTLSALLPHSSELAKRRKAISKMVIPAKQAAADAIRTSEYLARKARRVASPAEAKRLARRAIRAVSKAKATTA